MAAPYRKTLAPRKTQRILAVRAQGGPAEGPGISPARNVLGGDLACCCANVRTHPTPAPCVHPQATQDCVLPPPPATLTHSPAPPRTGAWVGHRNGVLSRRTLQHGPRGRRPPHRVHRSNRGVPRLLPSRRQRPQHPHAHVLIPRCSDLFGANRSARVAENGRPPWADERAASRHRAAARRPMVSVRSAVGAGCRERLRSSGTWFSLLSRSLHLCWLSVYILIRAPASEPTGRELQRSAGLSKE